MPNDDNPRVFDVSRPGRAPATPTSRPIIGSPSPSSGGDPMISTAPAVPSAPEQSIPSLPAQPATTQIPVMDNSSPEQPAVNVIEPQIAPAPAAPEFATSQEAAMPTEPQPAEVPAPSMTSSSLTSNSELMDKIDQHPLFSGEGQAFSPTAAPIMPTAGPMHRGKKRHILAWLIVIILVIIIGGYLAVDSGLVRGASHLPFHIFKQKTQATEPTSTPVATTQGSDLLNPTSTSQTTPTNLVKIPDLGIEITVPDSLKNLISTVANVDYSNSGTGLGTYPTAYLSTSDLETLENGKCSIKDASPTKGTIPPLGFLTKTTGQYPSSPTADNTTGTLVKQFDGYYISYRSAGTSCFSEQTDVDAVTSLNKDLAAALSSIQNL